MNEFKIETGSRRRQQIIKCLGHLWRQEDSFTKKKNMLIWQSKEKGKRGRPRNSWMGDVTEDLRKRLETKYWWG